MLTKTYEILSIVTVFQLTLFSIFLLSQRKGKQFSNRILAVFLASKALATLDFIAWIFRRSLYVHCPHLFYIGGTFSFLFGPSLYFYAKSVVYRNFSFKKSDLIHLIPFMLHFLYVSFKYHIYSADVKRELLSTGYLFNPTEAIIIYGLLDALILIYMIAALRTLQIYRLEIKKIFSSIEAVNLSWLNFILFGFIIMWLFSFSNFIVWISMGTQFVLLKLVTKTIICAFATILVYKALLQPQHFMGIGVKPKHERPSLPKLNREKYLKKMTVYMRTAKPYLEPSLNIKELAEKTAIPVRHLSLVINESLNQNFFDFINSYRIEEAKRHLSDHANNRKTVLEILYEVGFNSKSVFNTVFKKHTGMTPTEFKKRNTQQAAIDY